MGVIPAGSQLTARPGQIPSWESYDGRYRPVALRLMEVYAGFLAHTDAQVGGLIDTLEILEQWDNTLFIYITGDNGASAEGMLNGTWSSPSYQNGFPEDPEWLLEHMGDFGSNRCEITTTSPGHGRSIRHSSGQSKSPHTSAARATRWRCPCRPGITQIGGLRSQFHHIIDIAPTLLDIAGIDEPAAVNGIDQKPLEGVSMRYTFDDASAPSKPRSPRQPETHRNAGDGRRGAHNPEVAGSNPAPATRSEAPSNHGRGLLHAICHGRMCTNPASLTLLAGCG